MLGVLFNKIQVELQVFGNLICLASTSSSSVLLFFKVLASSVLLDQPSLNYKIEFKRIIARLMNKIAISI